MNKHLLKRILLTSLFLCCSLMSNAAFAQKSKKASAATVIPTVDALTRLKQYAQHIETLAALYPQEKVWLHFDNTAYFQGDTIWFKAYVRSTLPGKQQPVSKVLYVDLLTPSGRVLHTRKLKIENGVCHGDLPLSQVLNDAAAKQALPPSGFYEVRAYTRYMLNWDAATLFSRVFPVYDKPAFDGDYSTRMTPVADALTTLRPELHEGDPLQVEFYPEGGHTVVGLPCRVAYRVTDHLGTPIDATGQLVLADGITQDTHTVHDGMGMFIYTPTSTDEKLRMNFHADGNIKNKGSFRLPAPDAEGYTLTIDNRRADRINMQVHASTGMKPQILGMTFQQEGNLYYFDTLQIAGGGATMRAMLTTQMQEGVCQISLFDSTGLIADRLCFISKEASTGGTMQIDLSPKGLNHDELCHLHLKTTAADAVPIATSLSVAVRDADAAFSVPSCEDPRIAKLLGSEIKGYIHQPDYYFEAQDNKHRTALDLLLMVQGWRRYDWQKMAGVKPVSYPQYSEPGLVLNGYVYNKRGRKPIKNENVHIMLHNPGRTLVLRGDCTSDSAGNFNFLFDDFNDKWELSLQLEEDSKRKRELQYRIDRNLSPTLRAYDAQEMSIPASLNAAQTTTQTAEAILLPEMGISKSRKRPEGIHLTLDVPKENDRLADAGKICSDVSVFLDEMQVGFFSDFTVESDSDGNTKEIMTCELWGDPAYIICTNIQETSFNNQRSKIENSFWPIELPINEVQQIELYDATYIHAERKRGIIYSDSLLAAMLGPIDGFDPVKVDSLKRHLDNSRNAVIKVTAKPKIEQRSATKDVRLTTFDGYFHPSVFTADYTHFRLLGEDFRRTLYWNPDVQTDAKGEAEVTFRLNSQPHTFQISTVGQCPDGNLMLRSISVKKQANGYRPPKESQAPSR